MIDGDIESSHYLRNPIDVLAQQVVAHAAAAPGDIPLADIAALVRRSANFSDLSDEQLHNTLDLLAGRYPSEEFAELRPRIVWNRATETVRAREGSKRLAVTSGGTIPDRGVFGVFLPDGTRVGELDEEMVYESRPGETFLLGASTWRIEDITFQKVMVTPAPGEPGKMPFWHGDRPGRPLELGRALGGFVRELRELPAEQAPRSAARPTMRSTRWRPATCCSTSTTRPRSPAPCRTTARSWSSASVTRSGTGGSASSARSARPCTRRGRWRSSDG